jgi:hypothetical protein
LPAGWTTVTWAGGSYQVSGGQLTVNGVLAQSPKSGSYGRSLEFVAAFGAAAYQHVGFNPGGDAWGTFILISTSGSTNAIYARLSGVADVAIGGPELIGSPHRYRIDWNQNTIAYYVDGDLKSTRTAAVSATLYPIVADYTGGGASLSVDWLVLKPYVSPGVFTSRVFDQTGPMDWGTVTWNATTPANTGLAVGVRTSTTTPPEAGWTPFAPVANAGTVGENARYLQYQATLTTSDGMVTPSLEDISFACAAGSDLTLPVISNVVATPTGTTATITWDTDEFSNSRVDYGTTPLALGQNVPDAAIVRAHSVPLTGLTPGVTYYYRVSSTDRAGNAATDPSPPGTRSFMTTMPVCFADQDSAHFGAGTHSGTAAAIGGDGEVILTPTVRDEFSGTGLSPDWYVQSWGGPGCTVAAGKVTVNGARLSPTSLSTYGPGRVMEFVATFTGPGQHLGLAAGDNSAGGMFNTATWAIFSTMTQSSVLYARVNTIDVSLGTNYPGGTNYIGYPHDYWIEWRADSVVFLVDGRSVSRQANSPSAGLRPGFSDNTSSTAAVPVDWVRLTPYAASGSFTSRVYDGGGPKSWGAMSWTATLPTGTSLAMSVRGGPVADPLGGGWTDWQVVGASGGSVGLCTRYVQYKADLATTDLAQTPTLKDVSITCGSAGTVAAVTELSATPATSGHDASGRAKIQLTWTGGGGGGGGVKVYRKAYGDYPLYRVGHGAEPAAPASPAAALSAGWTLVTGVTASGQSDQPPDRDYWYYVAFDTDVCGNASAVSNRTGGTLAYLLGDVSDGTTPCAGDNWVNMGDVSVLGTNYGATIAGPSDPLACMDVGPAVDYPTNSRPQPDGVLEFEDLVLYALNFRLARAAPGDGPGTKDGEGLAAAAADGVALVVPALPKVGEAFAVVVHGAGKGDLQALSLTLDYDRAVVEMVGAEAGQLLGAQGAPALVLSPQPGRVDVALLGAGARLTGEGDLATVRFKVLAAGDPKIWLTGVDGRDGQNRKVTVAGAAPAKPPLPTVTQLAPAKPNPFSQSVTLAFSLAKGGPVDLAVYSVDGRKVRTLVRGVREPGEYSLVWDGRDDGGRAVGAGVYYARLMTPHGRFTRTVTYLK